MPSGIPGNRTSPLSQSEQFCTLCGESRPLREPDFSLHAASQAHRAVVADWERQHTQHSHHDGHKALSIDCKCEQ